MNGLTFETEALFSLLKFRTYLLSKVPSQFKSRTKGKEDELLDSQE